jgi:hypothetical protein
LNAAGPPKSAPLKRKNPRLASAAGHHRSIAGRSNVACAARLLRWERPRSQQASYCYGRTRVLAARGTIGVECVAIYEEIVSIKVITTF